jgi:aminopeptidase N
MHVRAMENWGCITYADHVIHLPDNYEVKGELSEEERKI